MTRKGIDISHWNRDRGPIDYKKVKEAGYDFVIIKAGGSENGFYKDKKFEINYQEATAAGMDVGAYWYIGPKMLSVADGEEDAEKFYQAIKGKKFSMPIYADIEENNPKDKAAATVGARAFCRYLEKKGYFVGIYASDISGFDEKISGEELTDFTLWVARYGKTPKRKCDVWQYSSTAQVPGCIGSTDVNVMYRDLPTIIKGAHKNGY